MSRLRSAVRPARPRPGPGARARWRNAHRRRRLATAVRRAAELTRGPPTILVEPATWLIGDALVRVQIEFVYAPLRGAGILSSPPRSVLKLDIFVVDLRQSQATPLPLAFAALRAIILKCQSPFLSAPVTQDVRIDLALPSFIGELYRPMIDDRLTQQLESCAVTGANYFERLV